MERRYIECDPHSAPQFTVARNSNPDIPFAFIPDSGVYHVSSGHDSKHLPSTVDTSPAYPQPRKFLSRRKKWILVAVVVLLAIIIAASTAGGVIGKRNRSTSTESFSGTASTTPTATSASNNFNPSPTGGSSTNSNVDKAWAYNGTSIMSLTFSTTKDTTGTNYVVFYQHSNQDIRQVVYNNSQWHSSQYVTNDARPGSPITAYWGGDSIQYNLFYVDKNNVLQETRGSHASNSWLNGTLGQLGVLTSNPGDISVVYVGSCAVGTSAWLLYSPEGGDQMGILYWDGAKDTWSHKGLISDVKPGAGFAGHADVGVWRYYYVQQSTSQLKEQVCPDCCSNSSSIGWRSDLTGPTVNSEGGLSVTGVGLPRLIYYGDGNGSIRELNNSYQYPTEAYIADVSSHAEGGNTGISVFGNMTASMPSGMVVATGNPNGKVSMASGFRGKVQQLWLFYQASGHDLTVQVRDSDAAGNWTEPSQIPVGVD